MTLIQTVNLGHRYKDSDILKDINLTINRGEVFALIGPTGSGKTTLLRLLDLLEVPSSGRIYFDGSDVTTSKSLRLKARRRMSFVLQKPIVFKMSVFDNVACGLRWRGERKDIIKVKVDSALELVGLSDYHSRDARALSGGETQRVAIARAIVVEPEVLLLDEPTANLDPISSSKIEEILARIIRERKMTVIMATHDMSQGQRLAQRVGVMMGGRILQMGSPSEIFSAPKSKEVAEFVGMENILSGVIAARDGELVTIKINDSTIQAISDYQIGEKVHALIRPEEITFSSSKDVSSARNIFEGIVTRMTTLEPLVRIEVDCGFPLLGVITKRSAEELGFDIGKRIYASFKATAIHVIKRWH